METRALELENYHIFEQFYFERKAFGGWSDGSKVLTIHKNERIVIGVVDA
jgi:hypothetical protein